MRFKVRVTLAALIVLCSVRTGQTIPQLINYQGILTDGGGTPITIATSVEFRIWDMAAGGVQLWTETQIVSPDANGQFRILLGSVNPIPESTFKNDAYLGLTISPDPEMTPRSQLVSIGYSFRTGTVDGASGGSISSQISIGPLHGAPGLNAFVAGYANDATGDLSTISGGSTNNATEIAATVGGGAFNDALGLSSTVGGGEQNTASGSRATVSGGLDNSSTNLYATVGGGQENAAAGQSSVVSGGAQNHAAASGATVAGGTSDTSLASRGTISGGHNNVIEAQAEYSTISGGLGNRIVDGLQSAISGGRFNAIAATGATIPGGASNAVTGNYGLAAGYRAKSQHDGSFIWADNTEADFVTTGDDQFLIRANGNVGVNTNVPHSPLTVLSEDNWRWSSGNGWGDFSVGAGAYGICFGVALGGGGAGAVRIWPKGGAEQLIIGNPTAGDVLAVDPSGHVGINASASNVLTLPNINSVEGRALAYAWDTYSSRRWKENISTIEGALGKVQQLRGVEYDSKDNGVHDIGLIAEEVGAVIPEVVTYEDNGIDARSIEYAKLVAVLIEAVKELKADNDELRAMIENQSAAR